MAGLTAAQIVALACQAAKVPNFTSQAGQYLNMVLQDLCQMFDFEVARKTFYFNFNPGLSALVGNSIYGSGPYPLPADYLRAADDESVFWTLQGVPYTLIPIDLSEFDRTVQQAGLQSYPYWYATNLSLGDETSQGQTTPVMYVYPPPSGAYPMTVRYFAQMPDIATPETSATIPWFPNQAYLVKAVTAKLMEISDDERLPAFIASADDILTKYMKLKDDKNSRSVSVKLDRRLFGKKYSTLKNTKTVGWALAALAFTPVLHLFLGG